MEGRQTMHWVTTIAGSTGGVKGHRDGVGTAAMFYRPFGLAVDGDGSIIVADQWNHRIRKITPQGHVSTLAGTGETGHRDGGGSVAQFNEPSGVVVDGDDNVIVADKYNQRIRKITPQGHVSTLAGSGERGHRDGEGIVAQFYYPFGVAVDGDGNVIVTDWYNHRIRKITPQGHVSTLAGNGIRGHRDGGGSVAEFNYPFGVTVDGDNNVIVADMSNHRIRKITPQGQVSTLSGTGEGGHRNGEGAFAQFDRPYGVAVNGDGSIMVADTNNHCIRKITPKGHVSTLAGTGVKGHRDGEGTTALFNYPSDVAVDREGNLIVADRYNHCIRKITQQGHVSTLVGTGKGGH
jgi:streptogramin lyase